MPKRNSSSTVYKDPVIFERETLIAPKASKLVLGLDLGTRTGYAIKYYDPAERKLVSPLYIGQWDLSAGDYDSGAIRFIRLRQFLNTVLPDAIFYERVRFTPAAELLSLGRRNPAAFAARMATSDQFFGALMGVVSGWAEEHNVPCEGFPIQQIKKHATGRGNCGKPEMLAACNERFGTDYEPEAPIDGSDNEADAVFVLDLGLSQYGLGI